MVAIIRRRGKQNFARRCEGCLKKEFEVLRLACSHPTSQDQESPKVKKRRDKEDKSES